MASVYDIPDDNSSSGVAKYDISSGNEQGDEETPFITNDAMKILENLKYIYQTTGIINKETSEDTKLCTTRYSNCNHVSHHVISVAWIRARCMHSTRPPAQRSHLGMAVVLVFKPVNSLKAALRETTYEHRISLHTDNGFMHKSFCIHRQWIPHLDAESSFITVIDESNLVLLDI